MKCARVTKNLVEVAHNEILESVYDILYLYAYKTPGHVLACLEYFLFHFRGSEIFILHFGNWYAPALSRAFTQSSTNMD